MDLERSLGDNAVVLTEQKPVVDLKEVLRILNSEITSSNFLRAYGEECWKNKFLEIACIIASDFGNTATAGLLHGWNYVNSIAAVVGGGTGLSYASWHINRGAKKEGKRPSFFEVASAALSAEVGCVVGTNLVTSGMAYSLAGGYDFLSPESLGVRGLSWLLSWPVGTAAMSVMTLMQKDEAGRFILESGKTEEIGQLLREDLKKIDFGEDINTNAQSINVNGKRVTIYGKNSDMDIVEKDLPQIYARDHNPETDSLYSIKSPLARYFPDVKEPLTSFAGEFFKRIGCNPVMVENPFVHDSHRHAHAH